jgi:hypothetical protein
MAVRRLCQSRANVELEVQSAKGVMKLEPSPQSSGLTVG